MTGEKVSAVLEVWMNDSKLCQTASGGVMAIVGRKGDVTRQEVCHNVNLLMPVVTHMGFFGCTFIKFSFRMNCFNISNVKVS